MASRWFVVGPVGLALALSLSIGPAAHPHSSTAAAQSVADAEPTPTPSSTPAPAGEGDAEWGLVIDGLVQTPLTLTLDDLKAMPATTVFARRICVGLPTNPLDERDWTGVRLGYLLEEAGVSPEAIKVAFYASDGFMTDLTLPTAMRDDVILAYGNDFEPVLGDTVRLIVPGKWGYKWIATVVHIELVNYDFLGTYETRGWSDQADIPGYWGAVGGVAEFADEPNAPEMPAAASSGPPWAWITVSGLVAGAGMLTGSFALVRRRRLR